tara:strand:- start:137 stop:448 length:312 start_codon:yes stop_codon:yes gene_type:complete
VDQDITVLVEALPIRAAEQAELLMQTQDHQVVEEVLPTGFVWEDTEEVLEAQELLEVVTIIMEQVQLVLQGGLMEEVTVKILALLVWQLAEVQQGLELVFITL